MILRRAEHAQMCVLKGSHCLYGKARSGRVEKSCVRPEEGTDKGDGWEWMSLRRVMRGQEKQELRTITRPLCWPDGRFWHPLICRTSEKGQGIWGKGQGSGS